MKQDNLNSCCCRKINDDFIKRIVELIGPVILGIKPAEILSFPYDDMNFEDKMLQIENFFTECKKIDLVKFTYKTKSVKVIFYNSKSLEKTLKDKRNSKILKSMGYPKVYNLKQYLDHLVSKMSEGSIPHEIGIFLGYPLKDVLGFLGHPSLKLTKVNGWRVYGDPRISDEKFKEFISAKFKIKNMLKYHPPKKVLLTA